MAKMQSCCSKFASNVNLRKAELRADAARAARRVEKGLSVVTIKAQIESTKAELAEAIKRRDEHDAEHAGQPESA